MKVAFWRRHLCLIAPALALVTIGLLPVLRLFGNLPTTSGAAPPEWQIRAVTLTSITLWTGCVVVQVAIALRLGPRLAGTGLLTVAFCSPALLGPAVNALLWKATLHPGNGLLAQALRSLSLPGWANTITAPLMIGLVQTWTWGLAASAAVAVLFSGETAQARSLYLLDGGNPFWAELWALWATRREWLLLVILAISVENFRTYEITQVLTGGAFRTATFSFEVYETGFVVRNAQHEAIWAMLLLLVNGVATTLILRVLRAGRQA